MKTAYMLRRRTVMTSVAVLAIAGMLFGKLIEIQIVYAQELQNESVSKKRSSRTVYGDRGDILDSRGIIMATTVYTYTLNASPYDANAEGRDEMLRVSEKIGQIIGQTREEVVGSMDAALLNDPKSRYVRLASNLDVAAYNSLRELNIWWLGYEKNQARSYPNGAVAGNLLGYLSEEDNGGLEGSEDECLSGQNGKEVYQRGANGVEIPGSLTTKEEAQHGGEIKLTIDSDLQWFAEQTLAQETTRTSSEFGFVTVAEAKTGKIKAVAQWPTMDPNNIDATPMEYWSLLPATAPYEPGSTLKALTAAMIVDQGVADPHSSVVAPGRWESGNGASFKDAWAHGPMALTLTGALMVSSNTGIAQFGRLLEDQTRHDYLVKFGLGQDKQINYPAASSGILHPTDEWDDQTKYATMFGQGLSATQLQMVSAYQALANNGVRIPLSFVESCTLADGTPQERKEPDHIPVVSSAAARTTLEMMESVVDQGELSKQISIPGYRIAAKTGTAEQPDGMGGYRSSFYISLMGVVPVDDPQYVVSVNLGYPKNYSSSAAVAPLFHTMMNQVIKTYRVNPSTVEGPRFSPYP